MDRADRLDRDRRAHRPALGPEASPPVVLAAIDTAGCLPIALELGLYKRVTGLHAAALHARWSATDWAQDGAAYAAGLPLRVTENLEEVGESARFERDVAAPFVLPGGTRLNWRSIALPGRCTSSSTVLLISPRRGFSPPPTA